MNYSFAFRNIKASSHLRHYAIEKLDNLILKFVPNPISAKVTFVPNGKSLVATCSLATGQGIRLVARSTSPDPYAAVDGLLSRLRALLQRWKEKQRKHHFHRRYEHHNLSYAD